ncbi:NRAMP family divalent metal transporter [Dictyobacter arantiisoli]|uniref:Iron transporter n=1 Tax=Dictyobacter arantiisoli TaxID=2014874 RepID=A0A5A5TG38_9CHLR|nr:divalent metal cation transporter [Dictyobacter arantiisoli]GCF10312.1 hypothetical protein KDI_38760 [Dictyobacter arantiisoli]
MSIENDPKGLDALETGMRVETPDKDLGETDVSQPRVKEVIRDREGAVAKIIIQKGAIFKKELEVPADRIQEIITPDTLHQAGQVVLDINEQEADALNVHGIEEIEDEQTHQDSLLEDSEKNIPTTEGIRAMEAYSSLEEHEEQEEGAESQQNASAESQKSSSWLRLIGPGFISGMAGNDSSAVASYSVDGAQVGLGHLWLLLLSTPLYQAVQYSCAKVGRITQKGFAEVLRENYGRSGASLASLALIIANVALITADLVAIGSGFQLLTTMSWVWFTVPIAVILWYLTVFSNFDKLKKVFIVMSLAFIVYIVTDILARPDWIAILTSTVVPHIDMTYASISSAVALLGATISPYNIFWQVQGEKEERRQGTLKQKLRTAALDVGIGVVSGNMVAYFIIICTATTLYTHHKAITTAADAAIALVSVLGPVAKYLFAIGLIGSGLVAIPVLLASTSYAVAGTFGWPSGLSKKPWQSEGFYLILTGALVLSLFLALLHLDPIQLILWANIISGILAPVLIVYLILVGNNRKIMKKQGFSWLLNICLGTTFVIMVAAAILFFYSLATGRS